MSTFLPFWGSKCGAVVRALSSHQCGPGFKSQCQRHMWVEFVVGSLPCSERFFSGFSGFPSPDKPTFPNSNSTSNQVDEGPQRGCATFKSLCILFIHSFIYWIFPCLLVHLIVFPFSFITRHRRRKDPQMFKNVFKPVSRNLRRKCHCLLLCSSVQTLQL